jgi:hypothetical protein
MTLSREEGGLGLFSLKTFLGGQACAWTKRAQSLHVDDYWKLRLLRGSLGNVLNLQERYFNKNEEPVLHNITKNIESFQENLTKINQNFKESFLNEFWRGKCKKV